MLRYSFLKNVGFFVALAVALGAFSMAKAAPLTLKFEAVISDVEGSVASLNLSFPISVGQTIHGQYVFADSSDLLDILQQPQLGKQGAVAIAFSDSSTLQASVNNGTINDGGVIDINNPLPPGPKSSLALSYLSPTDVMPGFGGEIESHPADVSLALVGTDGIISIPEDILDVKTWNQLTLLRQITLRIGYPATVTIRASIGSFVSVPEPNALHLFLGTFIGSLALFRK